MILSDFSIRRPVATVVIVIALMCLGLLALKKLRVNQIPDVQQPVMVVNIPYPGASPETVEREIVNRVEKALQSIPQVYQLRSTSAEGNAQIVIIFNFKKNMVEASDEIRNAIASVRYKLPVEMREPILQRIDPSAEPIMQLALSSTTQSHAEISRLAEDELADRFRSIDGVAVVSVNGSLTRELSVLLRAEKLREYNVSVTDVVNALRGQNTTAPVGRVHGPLDEESIRLVGRIASPREFNEVVVKRTANEVVRLGQVATVQDGFAEVSGYSLRNGHANVNLSITRSRDASTVTVADKVRDMVAQVDKTLPRGTKLEVTMDGGKDAENSLHNVIDSLMFGAVLTVFVVYVFLNSWRSTLITALALPTSVITAFIAVWLCGFTLNFMTPARAVAGDRRADRRRDRGAREHRAPHAARRGPAHARRLNGTAEIGLAVAATTFSIVAVFIPVAFMPGIAGEWFRPFGAHGGDLGAREPVHLVHARPDAVGLLGRPGRLPRPRRSTAGAVAAALQRLVRPPGRPLRPRDRLGAAPPLVHGLGSRSPAFAGALALQATVGGTEFLPKSDCGTIAVDIRMPLVGEPGVRAPEAREGGGARAHAARRPRPPTASCTRVAGASTSTSARAVSASAPRSRSPRSCARSSRAWWAPSTWCSTTSTTARGSRCRSSSPAPTRASCWRSPTTSWTSCAQVPGAVDVGLSEQDPKHELQDRPRPRPGQLDGHLRQRRGAGAARRVRGRRGGRLGRSRPASRATSRCACTPMTASTPATSSACRSRWAAAA